MLMPGQFFRGMCCILALGLAQQASAWEVEGSVPLPRPVGDIPAGVNLDGVTINVTGNEVKLLYLFKNTTRHPQTANFSIYLPAFTWSGVGSSYPDRHFPELAIVTGDEALTLTSNTIALHRGKDITGAVTNARLTPSRVGKGEEALLRSGTKKNNGIRKLLILGALKDIGGGLVPAWAAQTSHSWKTTFPPLADTSMAIAYKARPRFFSSDASDPEVLGLVVTHCGNLSDFKSYFSGDLTVRVYEIHFPLGNMNPDKVLLNFRPTIFANENNVRAIFMCAGGTGVNSIFTDSFIQDRYVRNASGTISVLVLTTQ